ncbi:hypothetical protein [Methanospirillum hungatei]|uniref:hypothetical protein n=1 Tax=Methanospirillum hungatei TaxID=2203 RepID=UPI0026ED89AD|nr:hypothetical protein [Methanospirillum hungatei]MCA1916462.1 hypothetical protein [Methanospirillum hungatei]
MIIESVDDGEINPERDPAYNIASIAVDTGIQDLACEHDHYLYGTEKKGRSMNDPRYSLILHVGLRY